MNNGQALDLFARIRRIEDAWHESQPDGVYEEEWEAMDDVIRQWLFLIYLDMAYAMLPVRADLLEEISLLERLLSIFPCDA